MKSYETHKDITEKQAIIINSIMDFYQINGRVPTYKELATESSLPSKQSAYGHVCKILDKVDYLIPIYKIRRLRAKRIGYDIGIRCKEMMKYSQRIKLGFYYDKINDK